MEFPTNLFNWTLEYATPRIVRYECKLSESHYSIYIGYKSLSSVYITGYVLYSKASYALNSEVTIHYDRQGYNMPQLSLPSLKEILTEANKIILLHTL